jgi:hypothetical protein
VTLLYSEAWNLASPTDLDGVSGTWTFSSPAAMAIGAGSHPGCFCLVMPESSWAMHPVPGGASPAFTGCEVLPQAGASVFLATLEDSSNEVLAAFQVGPDGSFSVFAGGSLDGTGTVYTGPAPSASGTLEGWAAGQWGMLHAGATVGQSGDATLVWQSAAHAATGVDTRGASASGSAVAFVRYVAGPGSPLSVGSPYCCGPSGGPPFASFLPDHHAEPLAVSGAGDSSGFSALGNSGWSPAPQVGGAGDAQLSGPEGATATVSDQSAFQLAGQVPRSSGRWYAEVSAPSAFPGSAWGAGLVDQSWDPGSGRTFTLNWNWGPGSAGVCYGANSLLLNGADGGAGGGPFDMGPAYGNETWVLRIAADLDAGLAWFMLVNGGGAPEGTFWNGQSGQYAGADPAQGTGGLPLSGLGPGLRPAFGTMGGSQGAVAVLASTAGALAYAPPEGFEPWSGPSEGWQIMAGELSPSQYLSAVGQGALSDFALAGLQDPSRQVLGLQVDIVSSQGGALDPVALSPVVSSGGTLLSGGALYPPASPGRTFAPFPLSPSGEAWTGAEAEAAEAGFHV